MPPLLLRIVRPLIAAFVALVLIYLILPAFVILPLSFSSQEYLSFPPVGVSLKWYERLAGNPAWRDAVLLRADTLRRASLAGDGLSPKGDA